MHKKETQIVNHVSIRCPYYIMDCLACIDKEYKIHGRIYFCFKHFMEDVYRELNK